MGAPFFEGYYESAGLSKQLRRWWDEPRLREKVSQAERVRVLAQWIREREQGGARWVGMKHPLLSLCGQDLVQAWGQETRFIRCCRPLEDSIDSLKRLRKRVNAEVLLGTLMTALDRFFAGREHLSVSFAGLMSNPRRELVRLMEYLNITADAKQIAAAIRFIEPGKPSKVETEQGKAGQAARGFGLRATYGALLKGAMRRAK